MYPDQPLPSFVFPPEALKHLMLLHGSCRKPHGVGKEMLSHILNHIKQWVYFCCHLPHRYFLRWTKLPHTSLLLGTVADLTEGKSDFSMDVPSSQYRSSNCSATVTSAWRWMCKRTSYPACNRMRSAAWILLWWSMKKMERTMYSVSDLVPVKGMFPHK